MREEQEIVLEPSLVTRFWQKVKVTDNCWLWAAGTDRHGYGRLWSLASGNNVAAHRVAWTIHFGPIPEGLGVLHNCPGGDNPPCVNPSHLWLGTVTDNDRDRDAKGRTAWGEQGGLAKLTCAEVEEIRSLWTPSTPGQSPCATSQRGLARRYGVSQAAIWYILHGRNWAHLS